MLNKEKTIGRIKSNIKTVATLTVGLGVGEIVASAVREYKEDAKGLNKLFIKLGAVALTGMVVSMVNKYVEEQIDEVFVEGQKMYERLNNLSAQGEESEETEDATEKAKTRVEDYLFKTKNDALEIYNQFKAVFNKFGVLTEAQAKDILGLAPPDSESQYGWENLDDMAVIPGAYGYYIEMPRMIWLE